MDIKTRHQIILAHQNLVHFVISKINWKEKEELFGIGIEGLNRAIDGFNPTLGYKFSTYAYKVIRGKVLEHVKREKDYKAKIVDTVTSNDDEESNKLEIIHSYQHVEGEVTSNNEVSRILAMVDQLPLRNKEIVLMHLSDGLTFQEIGNKLNVTRERIRQIYDHSIAQMQQIDEGKTFGDQEISEITTIVECLPQRDRNIVLMHLSDGLTFQEIGDRLKIPPNRISRIYHNAIKRIENRELLHE